MVKIGSVVRRVLTFVPAHFKVLEFHRNRYRDADRKIVTALLPDEVVGKSKVSTDLLSHVVVSKYAVSVRYSHIIGNPTRKATEVA